MVSTVLSKVRGGMSIQIPVVAEATITRTGEPFASACKFILQQAALCTTQPLLSSLNNLDNLKCFGGDGR